MEACNIAAARSFEATPDGPKVLSKARAEIELIFCARGAVLAARFLCDIAKQPSAHNNSHFTSISFGAEHAGS